MCTRIRHIWQAEDYHHHSFVQYDAAMQILQCLKLKGDECILDVGCGNGKITAQLASHVPMGSVIGIDTSPEMIGFAQKSFSNSHHPNLTFLIQDAQQFNYAEELDIVFSSFALQWIAEKSRFFEATNKSLKYSGYLAATIPLDISVELEEAIEKTISLPDWSRYFPAPFKVWYFVSAHEYRRLLINYQLIPLQFEIIPQTVIFSSRESFEKYVMPWFSYLNYVPKHLQQKFFNQVIDNYLYIKPSLPKRGIKFQFFRLDFIAIKRKSQPSKFNKLMPLEKRK